MHHGSPFRIARAWLGYRHHRRQRQHPACRRLYRPRWQRQIHSNAPPDRTARLHTSEVRRSAKGYDAATEDKIEGSLKAKPCSLLAGKTPRHAMQTLGTEWGRNCIGDGFWINLWREGSSISLLRLAASSSTTAGSRMRRRQSAVSVAISIALLAAVELPAITNRNVDAATRISSSLTTTLLTHCSARSMRRCGGMGEGKLKTINKTKLEADIDHLSARMERRCRSQKGCGDGGELREAGRDTRRSGLGVQ